ncbi:MAG: 2TM domain-containing protein [Desulfobulbaceae bacterium]|nr:2TM domain-containing protein [Desulfobulbaceae bacterium]
MIVRKLRLERGWSQEQLAEISGLSTRTIQRVERGQKASLESQKALAAAFETDVSIFNMEADMTNQLISTEEEKALLYVRDIKGFYTHLIIYVIVTGCLFVLNYVRSSNFWAIWPAIGWGIGVTFHGLNVFEVFNIFGAKWEKRQVDKRMKRNS